MSFPEPAAGWIAHSRNSHGGVTPSNPDQWPTPPAGRGVASGPARPEAPQPSAASAPRPGAAEDRYAAGVGHPETLPNPAPAAPDHSPTTHPERMRTEHAAQHFAELGQLDDDWWWNWSGRAGTVLVGHRTHERGTDLMYVFDHEHVGLSKLDTAGELLATTSPRPLQTVVDEFGAAS